MKSVNGHTICTYPCCAGLDEVRFDNGRFSSVECQPSDNKDDDNKDHNDDDDDDTEDDKDRSHPVDRPLRRRPQKQKFRQRV